MNIDKTFESLGADVGGVGTLLSRVVIEADQLNSYGLRRKPGEEKDKAQLVYCLHCLHIKAGEPNKPVYYYDYKVSGVLKKALKDQVVSSPETGNNQ